MRKTGYEYNKTWRKKHPDEWQQEKKRYYNQFTYAPNSREPFTDEEIEMILAHNMPDRELSKKLGRTIRAIQVTRSKLKHS